MHRFRIQFWASFFSRYVHTCGMPPQLPSSDFALEDQTAPTDCITCLGKGKFGRDLDIVPDESGNWFSVWLARLGNIWRLMNNWGLAMLAEFPWLGHGLLFCIWEVIPLQAWYKGKFVKGKLLLECCLEVRWPGKDGWWPVIGLCCKPDWANSWLTAEGKFKFWNEVKPLSIDLSSVVHCPRFTDGKLSEEWSFPPGTWMKFSWLSDVITELTSESAVTETRPSWEATRCNPFNATSPAENRLRSEDDKSSWLSVSESSWSFCTNDGDDPLRCCCCCNLGSVRSPCSLSCRFWSGEE